jgi:phosphoribosyl 1,2-cyclic phosphodiesterase/ActR/RegA family two-component response regulator
MADGLRFVVVDDSIVSASVTQAVLEGAGHSTTVYTSSEEAMVAIPADPPDGVLLDIMMPGIDGLEMCSRLRSTPGLEGLKIIMCTAKAFDFDKRRAAQMGADGYVLKPIKEKDFFATLDKVMSNKVDLTFWGVRGTLPRPGEDSLRYGGNTSCVSLEFPRGQRFIFDAGTGIKSLGDHLMSLGSRLEATIFISHPHWDHINTLPFFVPLYVPGNQFEIVGASHGPTRMQDLVSAQMDGVYFPITMREFGSKVDFRDLHEGSFDFHGIPVDAMLLSHPGNCLGYRVRFDDRKICYITDQELWPSKSPHFSEDYDKQIADFISGADAVIMDTNYFESEYEAKVGWGHSSVNEAVGLAHRAEVKTLYLFHHDPNHDDEAIDRKLSIAQKLLDELGSSTECVAPAEGDSVKL